MDRERSRFGFGSLVALAGLAAWCWYLAARGPELGIAGRDLGSLAVGLGWQTLFFFPLGALVPFALPRMRSLPAHFAVALGFGSFVVAALVILVAAAPPESPWLVFGAFEFPGVLPLLAPLVGGFAGLLLGSVMSRGFLHVFVLLPVLAAIAVVLLAMVAVVFLLLTDGVPVADPVGAPDPVSATPDGPSIGSPVAFAARSMTNRMALAVASGVLPPDFRAALIPRDGEIEAVVSFPFDAPWVGRRWLNLAAVAAPSLDASDEFRLRLRSLRLGAIPAPGVALRMASRVASRWMRSDPGFVRLFLAVWLDGRESSGAAAGPGGVSASSEAGMDPVRVREHLLLLERVAPELAENPEGFVLAVRSCFALAAERSAQGSAVVENRAALVALAGSVGDAWMLTLAGMSDEAPRARRIRERLRATLNGRRDWARHFAVSAALVQMGPEAVSREVGILKERLDAAPGGSGFSFADLLADDAGAMFGAAATRNEDAARRMQAALAAGIGEADLLPDSEGLPEGLSLAELESDYGGIEGDGFRRVEEEISRRLNALRLYRLPPPADGMSAPE